MIIKQGDTFPQPTADLNADVTGASVVFRLKRATTGAFVLGGSATIDDAANGIVRYTGSIASLTQGMYLGEWVVTFAGGAIQRFPQDSSQEIVVRPAAPAA